jgi:DNA repair exonuclease SbcCD ATPase subunit
MEYKCPFCDYTETDRESVEGHISGKSNSTHEGKVGRMYRSEIEETGEPENIKEKLFSNRKEHARQSEIDRLRERNDVLEETVEELVERVDKQERKTANLERKMSKFSEQLQGQRTDIDDLEERAGRLEKVTEYVNGFFGDLFANRVSGSPSNRKPAVECVHCGTAVRYKKHSGVFRCPNCKNKPLGEVVED